MRIGALFSGGKDSTYAAYLTSKEHNLACLITIFPSSTMSYMFHYPNLRWTGLQAEAMHVPQVRRDTKGLKELELEDLRRALSTAKDLYGIEGICTGALASVYQKSRVERVAWSLGLECMSPLWGIDPETHLRRLIDEGFISKIVSVSALGLGENWLGRDLEPDTVDELVALGRRNRFHVGFEGGEGETFVTDCPMFSERIEIISSQKHWERDAGFLEITEAGLRSKVSSSSRSRATVGKPYIKSGERDLALDEGNSEEPSEFDDEDSNHR